jgi:uncharacterized alpha-E superfamily protein
LAHDEGRFDFTFWTILLRAASAYHAYRRVFPHHIDPSEVAHFLIFDPRLPRSLAFCLGEIQAMIEFLRRNCGLKNAAGAAEQAERMLEGMEAASKDERLVENLHKFNDWVQLSIIRLTDELGQAFFGYAQTPEEATSAPAVNQTQSQTSGTR